MVKILTAFVINLVAIYASVVFGPLKARRRVCMVNSPSPALFFDFLHFRFNGLFCFLLLSLGRTASAHYNTSFHLFTFGQGSLICIWHDDGYSPTITDNAAGH